MGTKEGLIDDGNVTVACHQIRMVSMLLATCLFNVQHPAFEPVLDGSWMDTIDLHQRYTTAEIGSLPNSGSGQSGFRSNHSNLEHVAPTI